ncbi:putative cytidine deaminase-like protein [Erysiphe necator]|uniref:Putative cytidine deaminase-like protein n=1 Tax=Uncinula necator TaxID=52586 RepID=A0A0B1P746_UNCNE|nr:putative cytidine deaminase-like protein [Erysiphe necator]
MALTTTISGSPDENDKGVLVPLKTCKELASRDKVVDVWVIGLENIKNASYILSLIHTHFPCDKGYDLNHLRRVAKLEEVPKSLRTAYELCKAKTLGVHSLDKDGLNHFHLSTSSRSNSQALRSRGEICSGIHLETESKRELDQTSLSSDQSSQEDSSRLIIVCPMETILLKPLIGIFSSVDIDSSSPIIIPASVPLLAPTSAVQAKIWSQTHWPTIYKKNNPFGPHPSIVSRAQIEILNEVGKWMNLAWTLARESKESGQGEEIGVVVVKRSKGCSSGRVVTVAGDARWLNWPSEHRLVKGNPAAHAVMRAIAMVATAIRHQDLKRKKKETVETTNSSISSSSSSFSSSSPSSSPCCILSNLKVTEDQQEVGSDKEAPLKTKSFPFSKSIFYEQPLSIIERHYYKEALLTNHLQKEEDYEKGYLCHGLEIYCTHEPCIMCSMAMIHSRFTRVVFERRMHNTGALTAEGLLGYGLFWRKELNWTMLAWQWNTNKNTGNSTSNIKSIGTEISFDSDHEMEDLQV